MSIIKTLSEKMYTSNEGHQLTFLNAVQTVAEVAFNMPSLGFGADDGDPAMMVVDAADAFDAQVLYMFLVTREVEKGRIAGADHTTKIDFAEICEHVRSGGSLHASYLNIVAAGMVNHINEFGMVTYTAILARQRYALRHYDKTFTKRKPGASPLPKLVPSGYTKFLEALEQLPQSAKDIINSMNALAPL